MKISTKGRYGIKALIDLAMYSSSEIVTLKSISERQNISEGYLEQIFSALRKNSLVIGRKGSQGGYILSRHTSEITAGQILRALEGDLTLVDTNSGSSEDKLEEYLNKNLWNTINETINIYFDSITLENLVDKYKIEKENIMYYI